MWNFDVSSQFVAKKKAVQLKKMGSPAKKTEVKAKPVEAKSNGSKKDEAVVMVKKLEDIKPKVETKEAAKSLPPQEPPAASKPAAAKISLPEESTKNEPPKTRKSVSREDTVKTPEVKSDPIKELREALTESLKAQNEAPSEPKEAAKSVPEAAVEVRREEKPKVDVMQTLTEACRKLEQLKSKKKEAPPMLEVAPRSPEGAAMTTDKLPEMEKSLKNSVISPVNMQVNWQITKKILIPCLWGRFLPLPSCK